MSKLKAHGSGGSTGCKDTKAYPFQSQKALFQNGAFLYKENRVETNGF